MRLISTLLLRRIARVNLAKTRRRAEVESGQLLTVSHQAQLSLVQVVRHLEALAGRG